MRNVLYTWRGQRWLMNELVEMSGVSRPTLQARFKAGWTVEQAVATPTPKQRRAGVVSNLSDFEGTGGGSNARYSVQIDFSGRHV